MDRTALTVPDDPPRPPLPQRTDRHQRDGRQPIPRPATAALTPALASVTDALPDMNLAQALTAPAPAGAQHDPCPACGLPHRPGNPCRTGPSAGNGAGTLGGQRAAIRALLTLADRHPGLPDLHITVLQAACGGGFDLQTSGLADFEVWRSALGIDPATVTWHEAGAMAWLSARTTIADIRVSLTGHADRPTAQDGDGA